MLPEGERGDTAVILYGATVVFPAGNHQVLAYLHPFTNLEVAVYASRETLEIRLINQTVLAHVITREIHASLFGSVRYVGVYVVRPRVAVDSVLPIRIGRTNRLCCIQILVERSSTIGVECVEHVRRSHVGIQRSLAKRITPLFGIQHLPALCNRLERGAIADVDAQAVFLGMLRGYHDYAIGSTATID